MSIKNQWVDWQDTRLAQGKGGNRAVYTVRQGINRLLPENRIHDGAESDWVIGFLKSRFQQRFIQPLSLLIASSEEQGEDEYIAVGFTIMAIASLMIETLACFRNGQWSTDIIQRTPDPRWTAAKMPNRWSGQRAFEVFLTDQDGEFYHYFNTGDGILFFKDIRCGILHQAETKGGWRIRKSGALVEGPVGQKSINAIEFLAALERELIRYETDLKAADPISSALWKGCRYKLLGICVSAGWKGDWPLGGHSVDWSEYWP